MVVSNKRSDYLEIAARIDDEVRHATRLSLAVGLAWYTDTPHDELVDDLRDTLDRIDALVVELNGERDDE